MARSALASRPLGKLPVTGARFVPAASVALACLASLLPIVSASGWWPDLGLLMLIAWRMLRADCWPAWWAAPLGFIHDLVTGTPIGTSVMLWPAIMLAMDLVDRRTEWRDYWIEWAVACALIAAAAWIEWQVAALAGAPVPLIQAVPAAVIEALTFPPIAMLAARIDRWRLGR